MIYVEITAENISGAELDTLVALIERGPLEDGDIPSKSGRDSLIMSGLAARAVVNCSNGFQVATYKGSLIYCERFGKSANLQEARAFRIAKNAIGKAK